MPEFRNVKGHIEVYDDNKNFLFSSDDMKEALEEYENLIKQELSTLANKTLESKVEQNLTAIEQGQRDFRF